MCVFAPCGASRHIFLLVDIATKHLGPRALPDSLSLTTRTRPPSVSWCFSCLLGRCRFHWREGSRPIMALDIVIGSLLVLLLEHRSTQSHTRPDLDLDRNLAPENRPFPGLRLSPDHPQSSQSCSPDGFDAHRQAQPDMEVSNECTVPAGISCEPNRNTTPSTLCCRTLELYVHTCKHTYVRTLP